MAAPVAEVPTREAFELRESIALTEGSITSDGRVLLTIIRPGVGKGKGRHIYEADMLAKNAHKFAGWKMYVDHQSDEAKRAAGGLPRSIRDLGGRVLESWWDPNVQAEGRFGQGAVMGWVRPTRQVRDLIEDDPDLVEASINARATSVRPATDGNTRAWIVEGIEDRGSIDWVSEAGAGGRVASLLESVYHDDNDEEMALLDSMTDQELVARLRQDRPELLEALASGQTPETPPAEGVTVEALREALLSDEGRFLVTEIIEAALVEERELIRAEARADADRQVQLRDLRDQAHELIREAGLTPTAQADLEARFSLTENGPTPELDVEPEIGEDGEVTRTAEDRLREAVESAIEHQRTVVREARAEARPTRVRGQGPVAPTEGEKHEKPKQSLWRQQLQEAGFENPDEAYDDALSLTGGRQED